MSIPIIQKKITFRTPTIGARDYVAIDGSGWVTPFPRKDADESLLIFLDELPITETISNFREMLALRPERKCSWTDVTHYLGRIFSMDPDEIPCKVAIAFWSQVIAIDKQDKKGKPCEAST